MKNISKNIIILQIIPFLALFMVLSARPAHATLPACVGCQVNEFGELYTMIGSFESGEGWVGGGPASQDLARHEKQAWTLKSLNEVDSMITRTFSVPLDLTKFSSTDGIKSDNDDFIDLWGYQHDLNLAGGSIHLDASPEGKEWTDYFSYYTLGENKVGWRYIHVPKWKFSRTGSPQWTSIKRARISIRSKPGTTSQFTVDLWRHVSEDTTFVPSDAKQGINIRCMDGVSTADIVAKAKDLGVDWVRVPFYWNEIERAKGKFNYTTTCGDPDGSGPKSGKSYDELVNAAAVNKLKILAIVYGTPVWAEKDGCNGINCPPAHPNYIKPFLADIKSRYGSKIKYWEIWNEPNSPGFFAGENAGEYMCLLRAAYNKIKYIDKSDTVVLGGVYDDGEMPIAWMDEFYRAGGGKFADVMAFHPYTSQRNVSECVSPDCDPSRGSPLTVMTPYNFRGHTRAMRAIMAVYGDTIQGGKDLWATEFGFTTGGVGPVSEATQGDWSAEAYKIASVSKLIQNFFVYELIDQQPQGEQSRSHEGNFGIFKFQYNMLPLAKESFNILESQF